MIPPAMFFVAFLKFVVFLVTSAFTVAALSVEDGQNPECARIAASISSSSKVYYPGIYVFNHSSLHNI